MSRSDAEDDPFALWLPSCGKIEGGRLHGYSYTFQRFVGTGDRLRIEAAVTPPNWPFPRIMLLERADYGAFHAVPGEGAKRIRANELVASSTRASET